MNVSNAVDPKRNPGLGEQLSGRGLLSVHSPMLDPQHLPSASKVGKW